jgi:hypothetical protein
VTACTSAYALFIGAFLAIGLDNAYRQPVSLSSLTTVTNADGQSTPSTSSSDYIWLRNMCTTYSLASAMLQDMVVQEKSFHSNEQMFQCFASVSEVNYFVLFDTNAYAR